MSGTGASARKLTMADIHAAAERLKNWGRWGADDEVGTLNYTRPVDIVAATRLVQKGKVISLALPYDHRGPQGGKTKYPSLGRFNPVHLMMRTGTDAYSGVLDSRKIRSADDVIMMPTQCGTQWDGLGHIFYGNHMWNGYDCRTVTSAGAQKRRIAWWGVACCLIFPACSEWNASLTLSRSPTKCWRRQSGILESK
jgi:hypothetical protein